MLKIRAEWEQWDDKHCENSARVEVTTPTGVLTGWYYHPDDSDLDPYWNWCGSRTGTPPEWLAPYIPEMFEILRYNVDTAGKVLEFTLN